MVKELGLTALALFFGLILYSIDSEPWGFRVWGSELRAQGSELRGHDQYLVFGNLGIGFGG